MKADFKRDPAATALPNRLLRLKRGFFKMSVREKALLLVFALALIGLWFTTQVNRLSAVRQEIAQAHAEADMQQDWLDRRAEIDAQYERLVAELNLAELPSRDEVGSQIDAMLRRYNFAFVSDLGRARTEYGTELAFHTIPLKIDKVTYPELKRFTTEFKRELPYVSLESISIRPQARDDRYIDAVFVLKSIERTQ